jgi:DNA repair exonuclease SbcCD ATPase subunit
VKLTVEECQEVAQKAIREAADELSAKHEAERERWANQYATIERLQAELRDCRQTSDAYHATLQEQEKHVEGLETKLTSEQEVRRWAVRRFEQAEAQVKVLTEALGVAHKQLHGDAPTCGIIGCPYSALLSSHAEEFHVTYPTGEGEEADRERQRCHAEAHAAKRDSAKGGD